MTEAGRLSAREALDELRAKRMAETISWSSRAVNTGPVYYPGAGFPNMGSGGVYTTTAPNTTAVFPNAWKPREHKSADHVGGTVFDVELLNGNESEHTRIAKWVGGVSMGGVGIKVPTLEGVEVAFSGDWIVRDPNTGIVSVYSQTDFDRDFSNLT